MRKECLEKSREETLWNFKLSLENLGFEEEMMILVSFEIGKRV